MNESKYTKCIETLDQMTKLKEDWNGYGAKPIPQTVVDNAKKILKYFEFVPEVYPTGRETVQFQWDGHISHEYEYSYFELEISEYDVAFLFVLDRYRLKDKYISFSLPIDKFLVFLKMGIYICRDLLKDNIEITF